MGIRRRPASSERPRTRRLFEEARRAPTPNAAAAPLAELFERLRRRARSLMYSADRRAEQSAHVGGDVLLQALKANPKFANSDHASAYFDLAIRHKLIDLAEHRNAKVRSPERPVVSLNDAADSSAPRGDIDPAAPAPEIFNPEQRRWLNEQLDGLCAEDRDLLRGYLLDLPAREYAKIIGVSEMAARKRVSRILGELRRNARRFDASSRGPCPQPE